MSSNNEILQDMHNIISKLLNDINNASTNMSHINNKINNIDKNYGLEDNKLIYSGIKKVFESDTLDDLVCMLSNYKYIIENKIDTLCEHEWVDDLIDINLDTSKHICYCSKCEITKI